MTGSLQEKNGKFFIVLNTYENGKRKQKWICTELPVKGNKRAAEKLLRDTLAAIDSGAAVPSPKPQNRVLFSDYVRYWLEQKSFSVDEVTLQGYSVLVEKHVIPYFSKKGTLVQNVSAAVLQQYVNEKFSHGRCDGKGGLSTTSLRRHCNVLRQALSLAVKEGLIPQNPCQSVTIPKTVAFHPSFYNQEQLQQMFDLLRDDPLVGLFHITALYGLRRSEVLGLQWDSIDFVTGLLTIQRTVVKVTKTVEKDKTKNAASHRSFPLTKDAVRIFRKCKNEESENRRLFGSEYVENNYVFKWEDGRPYLPDYVTEHFSRALQKAGLPHIRFHELRHSCASLLLAQGYSLKDVQEWLGHADIKTTANIYGHLDAARKRGMADALNGSLFNGKAEC